MKIVVSIAFFVDITEKKRLQERVKELYENELKTLCRNNLPLTV